MLLEFGHTGYVTKRDKFKKPITDKKIKAITVGYAENHTRDRFKLYYSQTKRAIMTRDVKWEDWKNTNLKEILKMFCKAEK